MSSPESNKPNSNRPNVAERGTTADALRVPDFRRLFIGSSMSNIGRWLLFAALGVLARNITDSKAYLGAVIFAQLAPLGLLSLIGGSLADTANRKFLLLSTQLWQMLGTFGLAALLIDGEIAPETLLIVIFVIGLGQGLYAPALVSIVPALAGERNLGAAIALNSMQVNGARVVGPALGGLLVAQFSFAWAFAIVACSYVFVITAIARTKIPASTANSRSIRDRIFGGFTIVRRAPQVGRPLLLMFLFAFACLPFIGQLPALAEENLGLDLATEAGRSSYGWFFAVFGLGALLGAASVGTIFLRTPNAIVARVSLTGFAFSLSGLALVESLVLGFFAVFFVGLFYFALPTALATQWQEHVDSDIRGRIGALWILAFGGTVPIANVIAGSLAEATSLRLILLVGAAAALMFTLIRVPTGSVVGEELLARD